MNDPIVAEVRKYRMQHTLKFGADLRLICADLRKVEATLADRLVKQASPSAKLRPRRDRGCTGHAGSALKKQV